MFWEDLDLVKPTLPVGVSQARLCLVSRILCPVLDPQYKKDIDKLV